MISVEDVWLLSVVLLGIDIGFSSAVMSAFIEQTKLPSLSSQTCTFSTSRLYPANFSFVSNSCTFRLTLPSEPSTKKFIVCFSRGRTEIRMRKEMTKQQIGSAA